MSSESAASSSGAADARFGVELPAPDAPAANRGATAIRETTSCPRMTSVEVERIVKAARELIEAHERRSPTSEYSTLGEDGALWELNFQLGEYRTRKGMAHGR